MAIGFNQCTFIGHLGRDPEMSYTNSGTAYTRFSIAVNGRKDAQGNESPPLWLNIVTWQGLAETVGQYATKGMKVLVQGRLETRDYTDKAGVKRTSFEIVASTVQFLSGGKPRESEGTNGADFLDDEHPF